MNKNIVLTILVSIITTGIVLYGVDRFKEHKSWLNWNSENVNIQKQKNDRKVFYNKLKAQVTDNLPDIEKVNFLSDTKADIYIKIPAKHTSDRMIVSDCAIKVLPKNDIDISNTNFVRVTLNLDKPNCMDGWCMGIGTKIFTSNFLNKEVAEKIKFTSSSEFGDDSIYINKGVEFVLESTKLNQPADLCINGKRIQSDGKSKESSGEYFINAYTNLKLNFRDKKYCYQKFSGETGFLVDTCLQLKDPNQVI